MRPIDTHPTLDPAYVRCAIASAGVAGDTRDAAVTLRYVLDQRMGGCPAQRIALAGKLVR